jgi:hypothetical protein
MEHLFLQYYKMLSYGVRKDITDCQNVNSSAIVLVVWRCGMKEKGLCWYSDGIHVSNCQLLTIYEYIFKYQVNFVLKL